LFNTKIANNMSVVSESSDKISNTANDKGWTLLAGAAEAGNVDEVEVLLAGGDRDIDMLEYDGCTPLALAAKTGHAAVVARLLAHGANPNLRDLHQAAPLWHAAKHGNAAVVRRLLASGGLSDVNLRPSMYDSETPLAVTLKGGHRETAELLAHADGIDPRVKTGLRGSETAIFSVLGRAACDGYEDVALTLLEKCDLGQDFDGVGSGDGGPDNNAAKHAVSLLQSCWFSPQAPHALDSSESF
jgi:ankyrin repeat protein